MGSSEPAAFSREWLEVEGFQGFLPFNELKGAGLPNAPGVYIVLRESAEQPTFLEQSTAGSHRGRAPTVPVVTLEDKWIDGTVIMNIGKAIDLRKRLTAYARQGRGFKAGHFGGRYIWQLADSTECVVGWRRTTGDPANEEDRLLALFKSQHGRLPFANLVN